MINVSEILALRTIKVNKGKFTLEIGPLNGQAHALNTRARCIDATTVKSRARKTLTPRFTGFFTDFEKKPDCFAVY